MKLLTQAIRAKLPALDANDGRPLDEQRFVVKYFCPWNSWTWYATEGEPTETNDFCFFGRVDGHESEWGYFMLSELESVRGPWGLKVERDLYFAPRAAGSLPAAA
jgi:hypothetical protein